MTDTLGRILIVDDERPVLDVLSEYFATQGYAVQTASSGMEALSAVTRERPDLVLLDVRMPGMDGVEVLRRLRATEHGLAVIMVTANEDVALARETLKIGAFDYVAKPFDFRYLDRAVAAGLVQGAGRPPAAPPAPEPAVDPWTALLVAVFRAARTIPGSASGSIAARLESAALGAARDAAAHRAAAAAEHLTELDLLLRVAVELGDLTAGARAGIDEAAGAARRALRAG